MITIRSYILSLLSIILVLTGCSTSKLPVKPASIQLPETYTGKSDTINAATLNWRDYYQDPLLIALIDTALHNNQELQIILQEVEISKNEIRARKGEYLPFVDIGGGAGFEKPARYSRFGALEDNIDIKPGMHFPEPLPDYSIGLRASWELDIWKKLRNAKKVAVMRYLATTEGKNFMVTQLVADIAESYYELMALDNMLDIINQNIEIQRQALQVVRQQKNSARVTQLAVNRFEAQLLNTQNLQYEVRQRIIEQENRIRFLTGRYSTEVRRNSAQFFTLANDSVQAGIPSQLLLHRADIRQAERELEAARLEVLSARASFLPQVRITAGMGYQAFNPSFLLHPESLVYNLFGDLVAPLVNRNALFTALQNANTRQLQATYHYQQAILNAFTDVLNQLGKVENYRNSYRMKSKEADILSQSVGIAGNLFNYAHADYAEVLLTQREALEARKDLIEVKFRQLQAKVGLYRALGGGWN